MRGRFRRRRVAWVSTFGPSRRSWAAKASYNSADARRRAAKECGEEFVPLAIHSGVDLCEFEMCDETGGNRAPLRRRRRHESAGDRRCVVRGAAPLRLPCWIGEQDEGDASRASARFSFIPSALERLQSHGCWLAGQGAPTDAVPTALGRSRGDAVPIYGVTSPPDCRPADDRTGSGPSGAVQSWLMDPVRARGVPAERDRGSNRPRYQVAAAVGAAPVDATRDAVGAPGALVGADHGVRGFGRKVAIAAFAVGAQLEHWISGLRTRSLDALTPTGRSSDGGAALVSLYVREVLP